MSTPSGDALKQEIDAGRMRTGNEIQVSSGLPAFTSVTQLTADASSKLQGTAYLPVVQPTNTGQVFDITGSPNGNILTQTLVAGATVTTATVAGYIRIAVTSDNSAIMSTSGYYVPFYTIV